MDGAAVDLLLGRIIHIRVCLQVSVIRIRYGDPITDTKRKRMQLLTECKFVIV